jgi:hypothetical protein
MILLEHCFIGEVRVCSSLLPKAGQGASLPMFENGTGIWSHCFRNQWRPCGHRPGRMSFLSAQEMYFLILESENSKRHSDSLALFPFAPLCLFQRGALPVLSGHSDQLPSIEGFSQHFLYFLNLKEILRTQCSWLPSLSPVLGASFFWCTLLTTDIHTHSSITHTCFSISHFSYILLYFGNYPF